MEACLELEVELGEVHSLQVADIVMVVERIRPAVHSLKAALDALDSWAGTDLAVVVVVVAEVAPAAEHNSHRRRFELRLEDIQLDPRRALDPAGCLLGERAAVAENMGNGDFYEPR